VTLGNSNSVDELILVEDGIDWDLLLEQFVSEIDLVSGSSSVDLDFQNVSLLLSSNDLVDLSVSNNSDNSGVFLNSGKSRLSVFGVSSLSLSESSEGLSLRSVPLLVESSSEVISQMIGPDSIEDSESIG